MVQTKAIIGRVKILKAVVKFVLNTKRFRNDYGF